MFVIYYRVMLTNYAIIYCFDIYLCEKVWIMLCVNMKKQEVFRKNVKLFECVDLISIILYSLSLVCWSSMMLENSSNTRIAISVLQYELRKKCDDISQTLPVEFVTTVSRYSLVDHLYSQHLPHASLLNLIIKCSQGYFNAMN